MEERRDFGAARRVQIGATCAHCERCRCQEFVRSSEKDTMRCVSCGDEHTYTALLGQIAAKVGERAGQTISDAEALQEQLNRALGK